MPTGGLLFIPDISGFSQFVEHAEIKHSQLIIQTLLETLINSNLLQLQVSEIEGDAILFYKYGDPPTLKEMYRQVEKMFCEFHHLLQSISVRRLCQCGACKEAEHLTLKIITHHGEFASYNVKEFNKLIGKDVIRAHQLLKNDIHEHEYWLITDDFYQQHYKAGELPEWMEWIPGSKAIENDSINYRYAFLTSLKDKVPAEPRFLCAIERGEREVLNVTKEVDGHFMALFYRVITLELRPQWMEGVKAIDRLEHQDNMVGVPHLCIQEGRKQLYITSYMKADESSITYEETTENKQITVHFGFQQTREDRTLFTIALFMKEDLLKQSLFRLFMKKRMKASLERSIANLAALHAGQAVGEAHADVHAH